MENTKFTEAPWEHVKDSKTRWSHIKKGAKAVCVFATEPEEADANLIAAAPDLYWALDLARQMFIANDINLPHTMAVISAALARARGER